MTDGGGPAESRRGQLTLVGPPEISPDLLAAAIAFLYLVVGKE